ncbi:MAG TPA: hypothetical protein VGP22_07750 [Albitalea sp.]|jgi:hypothetical protein|nr:hypothetical protein [Albitalea sp.]
MFKLRVFRGGSSKVSGAVSGQPSTGTVKAIVRVRTPGHVPAGLAVRSRIDDTMFTAEFDVDQTEAIAADPDVISISPAQPIQPTGSG